MTMMDVRTINTLKCHLTKTSATVRRKFLSDAFQLAGRVCHQTTVQERMAFRNPFTPRNIVCMSMRLPHPNHHIIHQHSPQESQRHSLLHSLLTSHKYNQQCISLHNPPVYPTETPSSHPSTQTTMHPIVHLTDRPSAQPTEHLTVEPTSRDTEHPTVQLTEKPSSQSSTYPT